jgi:hypothetical protein
MSEIIRTYIDSDEGWHSRFIIKKPKPLWLMDLFGNGDILLELDREVSRWNRCWMAFIFKTKWRKL